MNYTCDCCTLFISEDVSVAFCDICNKRYEFCSICFANLTTRSFRLMRCFLNRNTDFFDKHSNEDHTCVNLV